ncbi:2OG-Fe(II) oxygenase family protein [Pseudomonas sp. RIT778]|uniref:2OG-Fe(II) oxygenase family protein n=1 Tax=Pseudomonas sp. RIT778 TaxID=2870471 RepID=UPI0021AA9BD7|nr:2OG-Fe(II) oxygenase family protein [Pseudomonas sp. RIT778]
MPSTSHLVNPDLIKIRRLFTTPLASIQYPDAAKLNSQLKTIITTRMAQDRSGTQRSNDGGWQSANDFHEWGEEASDALVKFAKAFAVQMTAVHSEQFGLTEPSFEWKLNAWANVNTAGHSNALHGHPGAFWSGVYWVDAGGREDDPTVGGDLEFADPAAWSPPPTTPRCECASKTASPPASVAPAPPAAAPSSCFRLG